MSNAFETSDVNTDPIISAHTNTSWSYASMPTARLAEHLENG